MLPPRNISPQQRKLSEASMKKAAATEAKIRTAAARAAKREILELMRDGPKPSRSEMMAILASHQEIRGLV